MPAGPTHHACWLNSTVHSLTRVAPARTRAPHTAPPSFLHLLRYDFGASRGYHVQVRSARHHPQLAHELRVVSFTRAHRIDHGNFRVRADLVLVPVFAPLPLRPVNTTTPLPHTHAHTRTHTRTHTARSFYRTGPIPTIGRPSTTSAQTRANR